MQSKTNCSAYFRACRRHQAAIFHGSGDFGMSPFFGQLSVKAIRLTVRKRTLFPACAKGLQKNLSERCADRV
jgi:hypothetical protein